MATFVGHIKDYLKKSKTENPPAAIDISPVAEALGTIAGVAAKKDAGFKLRYRSDAKKGTQELDAEFTPGQAWELDQSIKEQRARANNRKRRRQAALPKPETPLQIEHFTERLRAQAAADPDKTETLVELFVEFLRSNGSEYQLPALAQNLEANQLIEMAAVVRRHINKGKGDDRVTVGRD